MKRLMIVAVVAALLMACATKYQARGFTGGFEDARIDSNTFVISVRGNAFTSAERTELMALLRAAEVTSAAGFDYFVIIDEKNYAQTGVFTTPSTSTTTGTATAYGNMANIQTRTTTTPESAIPFSKPRSGMRIKAFNGPKPADNPNAYSALEVIDNLGPRLR